MAVIRQKATDDETGAELVPKVLRSQKDYVPSPYLRGRWEAVGGAAEHGGFVPIEVASVDAEDALTRSEMFTDWSGDERASLPSSGAPAALQPDATEILEAAKKEAYEAGFVAGKAAGAAEAQAEAQQVQAARDAQMQEFQLSLSEQLKQFYADVEHQAVQLSLNVARKVLETSASINPEYIVEVIRRSLSHLGATKAFRIRVSPEDYEFITVVGLPSELSPSELGVEYVADEDIRAGCVIESQFGEVDLQVDHMWEQVRESIVQAVQP